MQTIIENILKECGGIIDYQIYDLSKPFKKVELEVSVKDLGDRK